MCFIFGIQPRIHGAPAFPDALNVFGTFAAVAANPPPLLRNTATTSTSTGPAQPASAFTWTSTPTAAAATSSSEASSSFFSSSTATDSSFSAPKLFTKLESLRLDVSGPTSELPQLIRSVPSVTKLAILGSQFTWGSDAFTYAVAYPPNLTSLSLETRRDHCGEFGLASSVFTSLPSTVTHLSLKHVFLDFGIHANDAIAVRRRRRGRSQAAADPAPPSDLHWMSLLPSTLRELDLLGIDVDPTLLPVGLEKLSMKHYPPTTDFSNARWSPSLTSLRIGEGSLSCDDAQKLPPRLTLLRATVKDGTWNQMEVTDLLRRIPSLSSVVFEGSIPLVLLPEDCAKYLSDNGTFDISQVATELTRHLRSKVICNWSVQHPDPSTLTPESPVYWNSPTAQFSGGFGAPVSPLPATEPMRWQQFAIPKATRHLSHVAISNLGSSISLSCSMLSAHIPFLPLLESLEARFNSFGGWNAEGFDLALLSPLKHLTSVSIDMLDTKNLVFAALPRSLTSFVVNGLMRTTGFFISTGAGMHDNPETKYNVSHLPRSLTRLVISSVPLPPPYFVSQAENPSLGDNAPSSFYGFTFGDTPLVSSTKASNEDKQSSSSFLAPVQRFNPLDQFEWPDSLTELQFLSQDWRDIDLLDLLERRPNLSSVKVIGNVLITAEAVQRVLGTKSSLLSTKTSLANANASASAHLNSSGSSAGKLDPTSIASSILDGLSPRCSVFTMRFPGDILSFLTDDTHTVYSADPQSPPSNTSPSDVADSSSSPSSYSSSSSSSLQSDLKSTSQTGEVDAGSGRRTFVLSSCLGASASTFGAVNRTSWAMRRHMGSFGNSSPPYTGGFYDSPSNLFSDPNGLFRYPNMAVTAPHYADTVHWNKHAASSRDLLQPPPRFGGIGFAVPMAVVDDAAAFENAVINLQLEEPKFASGSLEWHKSLTKLHLTTGDMSLSDVQRLPKTLRHLELVMGGNTYTQDPFKDFPTSLEYLGLDSEGPIVLSAQGVREIPKPLKTLIVPRLSFPPCLHRYLPRTHIQSLVRCGWGVD